MAKESLHLTPVDTWSVSQVAEWLSTIDLADYAPVFKESLVNGESLVVANHAVLKELAIECVGHRIKILKSIYRMKREQGIKFQEGDYIPNAYLPTAEIVETHSQHLELLKRMVLEKDSLISNMKNALQSAKSELGYYKEAAGRSSKSSLTLNTSGTTKLMRSSSVKKSPLPSADSITIRVYGNQLPNRQTESYKTFRIGEKDDCVKLILECLQKYKITSGDWKEYIMLLVVKDQDNVCLNPSDRIVESCNKYLQESTSIPTFIIQHIRQVNIPIARPLNLDPGTFLAANLSLNAVSTAVGVYDYEAQSRVELDVQVGAKFSILARDGEWCVVERNGQRGSVPTAAIFELEKADRSHANQSVLCLYEYARKSKYEVSISRGDKLVLIERYHHWYLVQPFGSKDPASMGLVPFSYITVAEPSPEPPARSDDSMKAPRSLSRPPLPESKMNRSPLAYPEDSELPSPEMPDDSAVRESFKASILELEKYMKQWESLLADRDDEIPGSAKTIKDTKKLMQYVFSPTSPIQHIIFKRPLSGIIAFTLEEICKKNAARWLQYANSNLNGVDRKDLDTILYSAVRKNYSSLMKIANLVLEDDQEAAAKILKTASQAA
ncbi:Adaptor for signal transduction [Kappamyces sp. JEL0829]|nr:Adaptor for signal transduction [Kappamyces sp. JEL0829]